MLQISLLTFDFLRQMQIPRWRGSGDGCTKPQREVFGICFVVQKTLYVQRIAITLAVRTSAHDTLSANIVLCLYATNATTTSAQLLYRPHQWRWLTTMS